MSAVLPDDLLRKMNHAQWLSQFALTLQETRIKRGQVVTPFLLGAVSRLQYASEYIALLEADVKRLRKQVLKPVSDVQPVTEGLYEQALAAGHDVTMWIGPTDPYGDLPGGRGWIPYDRAVAEAARMRGEAVTINTRIRNADD